MNKICHCEELSPMPFPKHIAVYSKSKVNNRV